MQNIAANIDEFLDSTREYIDTRAELIKLRTVDRISDTVSSLIAYLVIGGILCMMYILLNVALGWAMGKWFGSMGYGFLAVAGINGILALLFYLFRDQWIKMPIYNQLVQKLAKSKES